ncbi:Ribosome assembly 1 [Gossypium arboreum]|uniref:Ribosome assembly 1 n=1 Tax=Gossypium arboreum TaxID=29729 RepID=A0A0B0NTF0_GOSAR|nr:Ribosome assembly 1 [Gossypium arboreum]
MATFPTQNYSDIEQRSKTSLKPNLGESTAPSPSSKNAQPLNLSEPRLPNLSP